MSNVSSFRQGMQDAVKQQQLETLLAPTNQDQMVQRLISRLQESDFMLRQQTLDKAELSQKIQSLTDEVSSLRGDLKAADVRVQSANQAVSVANKRADQAEQDCEKCEQQLQQARIQAAIAQDARDMLQAMWDKEERQEAKDEAAEVKEERVETIREIVHVPAQIQLPAPPKNWKVRIVKRDPNGSVQEIAVTPGE